MERFEYKTIEQSTNTYRTVCVCIQNTYIEHNQYVPDRVYPSEIAKSAYTSDKPLLRLTQACSMLTHTPQSVEWMLTYIAQLTAMFSDR